MCGAMCRVTGARRVLSAVRTPTTVLPWLEGLPLVARVASPPRLFLHTGLQVLYLAG